LNSDFRCYDFSCKKNDISKQWTLDIITSMGIDKGVASFSSADDTPNPLQGQRKNITLINDF
jgi:hypothetical protein